MAHTYEQTQNVSVKYFKPRALQDAGDLVIKHEPDVQIPPAPPIIIRQSVAAVKAPPPLLIRERPPRAPAPTPVHTITIPGRTIEPPARQVIIERMPAAAPLPQDVVVERWLGYPKQKRRVTYQKPAQNVQSAPTPKNILVDWEATNSTRIRQKFNFLGIESADAEEYERRFGRDLLETSRLPAYANELNSKLPHDEVLATNQTPSEFILSGDVHALDLVDRRRVNLSEFLIPKWLFRN